MPKMSAKNERASGCQCPETGIPSQRQLPPQHHQKQRGALRTAKYWAEPPGARCAGQYARDPLDALASITPRILAYKPGLRFEWC